MPNKRRRSKVLDLRWEVRIVLVSIGTPSEAISFFELGNRGMHKHLARGKRKAESGVKVKTMPEAPLRIVEKGN